LNVPLSSVLMTDRQAPREVPDDSSERRLIEGAREGDRAAFTQLYQRHVRRVYRFIRLQVPDDATAEDLTQDVFVGLVRGLPGIRAESPLAPWLMQVARNRLANHWRSLGRRPAEVALPDDDVDSGPDEALLTSAPPESLSLPEIDPARLGDAIAGLTDLQRDVLALRFGAGLSLAETAITVGRSVQAVKNVQFKALAALRRQLATPEARP
jgi:RNA polymerase sigma-70 factor (ECF subfamily)